MKTNKRTGNSISPSPSQHLPMPLTAEQKPKPEWWWAWSQTILVRTGRASSCAAAETGDTHLAERVSHSTQQGRLVHRGAGCCPVQRIGVISSLPTSMLSPQGQIPNTPTGSLCGPCALSTILLYSYPTALLAVAGAATQPPRGAWAPLLSGPLPGV